MGLLKNGVPSEAILCRSAIVQGKFIKKKVHRAYDTPSFVGIVIGSVFADRCNHYTERVVIIRHQILLQRPGTPAVDTS